MRVLAATSGSGSSHSHHHHHQIETTEKVTAKSSAVETAPSSTSELRSRAKSGTTKGEVSSEDTVETQKQASTSLKLSAYLNLFGDFSKCLIAIFRMRLIDHVLLYAAHNITDGLVSITRAYVDLTSVLSSCSRPWLRLSTPARNWVRSRRLQHSVMKFHTRSATISLLRLNS
jgi:hypothetical protein